MNISLRGRIALWYALAVPALIFVLAYAAQQVMVLALRQSIEDSLEKRAETIISAITASIGGEKEDYDSVLERLTEQEFQSVPLLLRVANPRGAILAEFGEIPDPVVPHLDALLQISSTDEGSFDTVNIRDVEAIRVYTAPLYQPFTGTIIGIVQTGDSLAPIAEAQRQLWWMTLLAGGVGSVITLSVGLLLLRRGFRPLDRILSHVQEIESSNLRTGLLDEPRPPELQQLADNLNSMWARLDTAFNARQMFVASVSHEIKTPLTALEGQIEVLLMSPTINQEMRESLERMGREARRLVRMTNNLLLNAQLEVNPLVITEAVNLRELLEGILVEVLVLAEDVDLGLSASEDVFVSGDYDLIKQLALNIIDNAIKFTPRGGKVDVSLSREGDWAVLEVSDSGPGITREHLPHVMEAFYKGDAQARFAGRGAGLGLAIVKQIVELHMGEIEIRSDEGAGTLVKVRLPIMEAQGFPKPAAEGAFVS